MRWKFLNGPRLALQCCDGKLDGRCSIFVINAFFKSFPWARWIIFLKWRTRKINANWVISLIQLCHKLLKCTGFPLCFIQPIFHIIRFLLSWFWILLTVKKLFRNILIDTWIEFFFFHDNLTLKNLELASNPCGLDSSAGRAADRYPEGASSNCTRVNILQLTSVVSDYYEKKLQLKYRKWSFVFFISHHFLTLLEKFSFVVVQP